MDFDLFLDVIEIFAGVYMIFMALRMKQTGSVSDNGLISKGLDLNKAPDPETYIKKMVPVDIVSGVLLALCGIGSRIGAALNCYEKVSQIAMVVAVVVVIGFGYISIRAQKKYLMP